MEDKILTEQEKAIIKKKEDAAIMRLYQHDPFLFIRDMWGLYPQRVLPKYKDALLKAREDRDYSKITLDMFETFQMGKHITWQQVEIIYGIKLAVNKKGKRKISVASGHGIGKSAILSMAILWYLTVFNDSQVPCTSPSQQQMYDVLWKETAKWINRMPEGMKVKYEHQQSYIRMTENPKEWFARAATGRKENPEALAGVHADHVCMVADEASGIAQEVFDTSKGALTNENVILILISNPTRLDGYFYDSHNNDNIKKGFQTFQFSGTQSPVVNEEFIKDIIDEYGIDSDDYKIRVLGEFPDNSSVDEDGWVNLLDRGDINLTTNGDWKPVKLGIDPAGDGSDEDIMVSRDEFMAKAESIQKFSDEKKTAQIGMSIATKYGIKKDNVIIDNFGVGANVGVEMAAAGFKPFPVNVGSKNIMKQKDIKKFENPRAKAYRDLRTWLKKGGELVNNKRWEDLLMIKYKRNLNGKIQIMSKKEMKKKYGKSPDIADALMLTFIEKKASESDYEVIVQEF